MECTACKQSNVSLEAANLTIEKDGKTLHVKKAPVLVCQDCGEKFLDDTVIAGISKALDIVFTDETRVEILD